MLEADRIGRKSGDRWLLEGVSLSIHPGERLALVGPTGSGKTLLLRSLAMLDPLDAGEIRWEGNAVRGKDVPTLRSRVIYLHQRPVLSEGTVEDNLRQPFSLHVRREKQFDSRRVVELLASLGRNESFLAKQQRDLSGGEAQLAALLRAVQLDPRVLLLDEPTAAMDAESAGMAESLVAQWCNELRDERSTVWVTHSDAQAERVSSSMLQIRGGRLKEGSDGRIH